SGRDTGRRGRHRGLPSYVGAIHIVTVTRTRAARWRVPRAGEATGGARYATPSIAWLCATTNTGEMRGPGRGDILGLSSPIGGHLANRADPTVGARPANRLFARREDRVHGLYRRTGGAR